jgi:hypothetical protein
MPAGADLLSRAGFRREVELQVEPGWPVVLPVTLTPAKSDEAFAMRGIKEQQLVPAALR